MLPLQVHRASSWTFATTGAAVMTTMAAVVRKTPFGIYGPFVYENNLLTKTGSGQNMRKSEQTKTRLLQEARRLIPSCCGARSFRITRLAF